MRSFETSTPGSSFFSAPVGTDHWAAWEQGEERPHATIGYEANLTNVENGWLRLHYRRNEQAVDYKVRLVTTRPNFGGLRWWFICPLVRRDGGQPHRVAKLCLPPGATYFGSREGYGLTYASCQESGKMDEPLPA